MADHPITPPPELVKKIRSDALCVSDGQHDYELRMIHAAYAAGADHQLKACCEVLDDIPGGWGDSRHLLHVCRPKPLTPAEKALVQYDRFIDMVKDSGCTPAGCVRDALERLAELEAKQ